MNGIDFDKLERRYNRRLRLRNTLIFVAVYAILLFALCVWNADIAAGLALFLLLAWAITRFIFR